MMMHITAQVAERLDVADAGMGAELQMCGYVTMVCVRV